MEKSKKNKYSGKSLKQQNILRLLLLLIIVVASNIISSFVFTRFDLTSEKRFTLSPATKKLVSSLNDIVYVKVYLDGDFPPAFKRLQNATREMLDELRSYSNGNIEYDFINFISNLPVKEFNLPVYKLRTMKVPLSKLFFREL